MLGFYLVCFAAKGAKTKHRRTERRAKWKPLRQRTFSHACPECPFAQRVDAVWDIFGTNFSGQLMESWKIRANSATLLVSLPANEAMHVPWPRVWKLWQVLGAQFSEQSYWWNLSWKPVTTAAHFLQRRSLLSHRPVVARRLTSLGRTVFRHNRIDGICPEKRSALLASLPANEAMHVPSPNVCTPLDKSWAHSFSAQPHDGICPVKTRANTFINSHYISLPPNANGALPKPFLTVSYPSTMSRLPSRSLPTEHSPSYFPWFPVHPPCRRWSVVPPAQSKLNENPSIGDAFGKNGGFLKWLQRVSILNWSIGDDFGDPHDLGKLHIPYQPL